jgi:hypothetical protein
VQVKIARDGKETSLPITVGEMKETEVATTTQAGELGLTVQPLTHPTGRKSWYRRRRRTGYFGGNAGSAADEAGLRSAM